MYFQAQHGYGARGQYGAPERSTSTSQKRSAEPSSAYSGSSFNPASSGYGGAYGTVAKVESTDKRAR